MPNDNSNNLYQSNSATETNAIQTQTFTVQMGNPPVGASEINWFYYWVVE